jgi:hypothetical protein
VLYSNYFYNRYEKNVHSQNGEDGIIEELLNRLSITSGWTCEFGAWDGKYLSNTFALTERGWSGVFIEGDPEKYKDLLTTASSYPSIVPINAQVDHQDGPNSLDNLLASTPIPQDFDLLSIDVDSYDYQIWKSLKKYKPKLVIIEINSFVNPNNANHIHQPEVYELTGFRPMFNLAKDKGYRFVIHTGNMIFVREDLFGQLAMGYADELENFRAHWWQSVGAPD